MDAAGRVTYEQIPGGEVTQQALQLAWLIHDVVSLQMQ
jgi:hypothetical protein